MQDKLLPILNEIYNTESPPDQWLKSLIIPIHKVGDASDPGNYRSIAEGLCISKGKTEYLRLGEPDDRAPLRVKEGEIKEVEHFKHI